MTSDPTSQRLFDEAFLRRLERMALVFRKSSVSNAQGERRSAQRGQSIEFSDFRPYTLGDDFRRIDWNAYARLERLFIKLFVEERDILLHLLIDNSLSMNWGEPNKLNFSLRAAAAIGYIALVGLDRVSAEALYTPSIKPTTSFLPVRGKRSTLSLFSYLQSITVATENLQTPRMQAPPGSDVVIFSDLMSDIWQPLIQRISGAGRELTLIHILSPDELLPNFEGEFRLVDSESREQVEITADYETIQRYITELKAWQNNWQTFCTRRQISYLTISSEVDLTELLFAMLPDKGVLR